MSYRLYLFVGSLYLVLACGYGQIKLCTTPNGESARCVNIHSCPILYNAVTTKNKEQLKFLRESQCGYRRRDPLVCCGNYDNYQPQNFDEDAFADEPSNWDGGTNTGWGNNNDRRTNSGSLRRDNDNSKTNENMNRRKTSSEHFDRGNSNRRTNDNNNNNNNNGGASSESFDWGAKDDRPRWGIDNNNNRGTNQELNNKLPNRSSCGFQDADRILGGQATGLTEFPWMALLQYRKKNGNLVFSCGGTLISTQYVLTAAHCVKGQILTKIGPLVNVRLGEYNTETEKDCTNQLGFEICNDKPFDSEVEKVIVHPDYRDNSADRYNDIALIKLKTEAPNTDFIKPICLPTRSEQSRVGDRLVVAGWGRTEYASSSPVKLKLWVPVAEKSQCSSRFRSAGVSIGNKQLCAGAESGKDSCNGDSGGPLMATTKNDTAQWYIEGIVSFGARCGSEGWPGIYTKVPEYVDWIKNNAI